MAFSNSPLGNGYKIIPSYDDQESFKQQAPHDEEPEENIESERNHQMIMQEVHRSLYAIDTSYALDPHATFLKVWNPILLVLVFIDVILQPVMCAFASDHVGLLRTGTKACIRGLSSFIWLMYVLDTLLQFLVQRHKRDGCGNEVNLERIALLYTTSMQFYWDILTVIPWNFVYELNQPGPIPPGGGSWAILMMLLNLSRCMRVCRLSTTSRLFFIWRHKVHLPHAQRTCAECGFALLMLIHYLACIWTMVGLVNADGKQTWLEAWEPDPDSRSNPLFIYTAAVYWALATITSIGYGDVVPAATNEVELAACTILMFVAAVGWIVVIANTVQLVNYMHSSTEEYRQTLDKCEDLFAAENMDHLQQHQIREYFGKYFGLRAKQDTQEVIKIMSPMLQRDTVSMMYSHWIADVPWMHKMSHSCLVQIVFKMRHQIYIPREFIPDLRIVHFVEMGSVLIAGHILRKGDSWGTDMTLEGPMRKHQSGHALNFVMTLGLWKRQLEEVLDDFPEDAWMVKRMTCFMALRRKVMELAAAARTVKTSGKRSGSQFLERGLCGKGATFVERNFTALSDDSRYLHHATKTGFEDVKARLKMLEENVASIARTVGAPIKQMPVSVRDSGGERSLGSWEYIAVD